MACFLTIITVIEFLQRRSTRAACYASQVTARTGEPKLPSGAGSGRMQPKKTPSFVSDGKCLKRQRSPSDQAREAKIGSRARLVLLVILIVPRRHPRLRAPLRSVVTSHMTSFASSLLLVTLSQSPPLDGVMKNRTGWSELPSAHQIVPMANAPCPQHWLR